MAEDTIICPYCSKEISLSKAIYNQYKDELFKNHEQKAKALSADYQKREDARERQFATEREKLVLDTRKKVADENELKNKTFEEELAEEKKNRQEAQKNELELRKRMRDLEEKDKNRDLDVARRVDADKEKILQQALEQFSNAHRLKDAEKDKKLSDSQKIIEDLNRKLQQGSMQTQGEVLELDLEEMLKTRFPVDAVEPVQKGIKGADIIQRVFTKTGQPCGTIVWESKRTKAWGGDWIAKLKDDQREVKADMAVLVTEAMPKGVSSFSMVEGVWVTNVALAGSLAEVLRVGLIQVAQSRNSAIGKNEKMAAIYNYLTGIEFSHRVRAVVDTINTMNKDLDREKRAVTKNWASREKQIERVMGSISGMYGDMHGIIGATLPEIKTLELESGEAEMEDAD